MSVPKTSASTLSEAASGSGYGSGERAAEEMSAEDAAIAAADANWDKQGMGEEFSSGTVIIHSLD